MRRSSFLILALAAVLLAAVAVWASLAQMSRQSADLTGKLIYPGLEARLNGVTAIAVRGKDASVDLVRDKWGNWVMPDAHSYPAAFDRVRTLLTGLASLKAVEPRTRMKDRYPLLGVEDPGPGATGTRITVKAGDETVADLIVGKSDDTMGPGNTPRSFVRVVGQAQSWLGEADLRPGGTRAEWLDRELVSIAPDRVAAVTIERDKDSLRISRDRPGALYTVAGIDPDKDLTRAANANALGAAASSLMLDDVAPVPTLGSDIKVDAKVTYDTFDGLVVEISLFKHDGAPWVAIEARFDADLAEIGAKLDNPPQADGSTLLKSAAAVTEEAKAIDDRAKGWAYRIEFPKAAELTPARADLVESKTPAPDQPAPQPQAVPGAPLPPVPTVPVPDDGTPADGAE